MNTKTILPLFAATLIAAGLAGCATEGEEHDNLAAMARVSRADAGKTALARVPGGTIKDGELEKENGKLIWSFDIATKGSKNITEVHVDANTGEIIKTETETPADQAREKQEEKEEKK